MNSEKEALDLPAIVTGNGEAYPKQWLAVYVRLYHEKKTSARLNTMGIENFLPIQEEIHQCIIRKTRRSRFQNEAFRFLGLFPKRSVSFFTKFERHSDGLPIQFECRFFIAFCGEKASARIAGLAFFLYLYIVVRMGHYSLLSYVE